MKVAAYGPVAFLDPPMERCLFMFDWLCSVCVISPNIFWLLSPIVEKVRTMRTGRISDRNDSLSAGQTLSPLCVENEDNGDNG